MKKITIQDILGMINESQSQVCTLKGKENLDLAIIALPGL